MQQVRCLVGRGVAGRSKPQRHTMDVKSFTHCMYVKDSQSTLLLNAVSDKRVIKLFLFHFKCGAGYFIFYLQGCSKAGA